jgi:hypothetical protein
VIVAVEAKVPSAESVATAAPEEMEGAPGERGEEGWETVDDERAEAHGARRRRRRRRTSRGNLEDLDLFDREVNPGTEKTMFVHTRVIHEGTESRELCLICVARAAVIRNLKAIAEVWTGSGRKTDGEALPVRGIHPKFHRRNVVGVLIVWIPEREHESFQDRVLSVRMRVLIVAIA